VLVFLPLHLKRHRSHVLVVVAVALFQRNDKSVETVLMVEMTVLAGLVVLVVVVLPPLMWHRTMSRNPLLRSLLLTLVPCLFLHPSLRVQSSHILAATV